MFFRCNKALQNLRNFIWTIFKVLCLLTFVLSPNCKIPKSDYLNLFFEYNRNLCIRSVYCFARFTYYSSSYLRMCSRWEDMTSKQCRKLGNRSDYYSSLYLNVKTNNAVCYPLSRNNNKPEVRHHYYHESFVIGLRFNH